MSELYENLLKATSNIDDITNEKYGVITKLDGLYCSVKETDNELEHNNVPIVNGANLSVGDKVIIGFLNNSIYDVVCYGALDKTVHDDSKQDLLISGTNIKTINHTSLLGSGNIDIQGGGSDVDIVTSWEPTPSDTKVPSEKLTKNTLDTKVDKVTGKGLSTNDFTNSYKNTIDGLSTVATTGDYDDLTDKPSIPSSSSDLSDGSNIVKKSSTSGLLKNDGSVDTNSYLTSSSLSNYVQKSSTTGLLKNDGTVDTTQYLSSLPTHNHDDRYYTESEVDTALNGKQATLVSGTNIKTINNTSLLGSGNISIQGGGTVTVDDSLSTTSTNPVQNKVITGALNGKANSSHTHTKSEITDFPSIPSKTSDLTNDTGFITSSALPTKTSDLQNDGDGSNVFVKDNDSRLSNARTPLAHTHLSSDVTDLIDVIYPVGSIYMSVNNVSPSTLFGGTWEKIKDKFLLASGDTYPAGNTGGEATHTLTVEEIPSHNHSANLDIRLLNNSATASASNHVTNWSNKWSKLANNNSANTGGDENGDTVAHNNMPPYIVVNVWKRTA